MYLSGHNIDVLFFAVGEMQMKEEYDLIVNMTSAKKWKKKSEGKQTNHYSQRSQSLHRF